ncbi:MFS transporter [Actinoallomurus rhizosphaericola]|uniref:MFS transporter n=1 Tax=Actinoallomurus rhizosphaericola TaxID=2952536 RepID=UPI002093DB77|nr:MFS transporter [Actinoallomurus rhizosphaericola]MCO5998867.1 MFS transporter [Actinoallomurus rhizosphaericola]
MPIALLALAIGGFGIGTTEFVISGLLPDLSADLHVSIPTAGLLVSGYAFGVVVGAPLLTALGSRISRKTMLVSLMALFTVGNLLCAVAPTYGVLMVARLVTAFAHGAYFGIGSVVAADLVRPEKRAGAIAMMFTGLTVANVLGVPGGTALGQALGWRSTFWVVAAIGLVALAGIATLVPARPRPSADTGLRGELSVFRHGQVWLALAMTALGWAPVFTVITYVAPLATRVTGFSSGAVPILMVLFGVGMVAGNALGGRLADRALMPSLYGILAAVIAVSLLLFFVVHGKVAVVVVMLLLGVVGSATIAPLQTRVLDKAAGAPTMASAANIAAFNLGNTVGPFLGGLAIDAGLGYASTTWIAALIGAAGLAVALVSGALDRRAPERAVGAYAGITAEGLRPSELEHPRR